MLENPVPTRVSDAEIRGRVTFSASLSEWLADHRTLWLVLGAVDLVAVGVMLVPGDPFLDLSISRLKLLGSVLSHAGVLFLAMGLYPARRRWLDAAARWSRARQILYFALAGVASLSLLGAIARVWPAYAARLLREFGPVEPVHVVLFIIAAWVAFEHARLLRSRRAEYRPYQLVMAVCLLFALEEVDYFGVFGAFIGRTPGVYVGTFHDLLNLAQYDSRIWVGLGGAAVVLLVALWRARFLTAGFLRAEALDATSLPLYLVAVFLGLAHLADVTGDALAWLRAIFKYRVEEPLELMAALCLNLGLLMKYTRDRWAH